MKNFKMSIQRGILTAPAMIVEAKDQVEAEKIARSRSGLGVYSSWSFTAIEMNVKRK